MSTHTPVTPVVGRNLGTSAYIHVVDSINAHLSFIYQRSTPIGSLTMYMNMRILMTMNIYITKENEEYLRTKESMSGYINALLERDMGERGIRPKNPIQELPKIRNLADVAEEDGDEIEMYYKPGVRPAPEKLAAILTTEMEDDSIDDYYTNKVFDTRTNDIVDTVTGEIEQERDPEIVKELKKRGQTR